MPYVGLLTKLVKTAGTGQNAYHMKTLKYAVFFNGYDILYQSLSRDNTFLPLTSPLNHINILYVGKGAVGLTVESAFTKVIVFFNMCINQKLPFLP